MITLECLWCKWTGERGDAVVSDSGQKHCPRCGLEIKVLTFSRFEEVLAEPFLAMGGAS